MLRTWSSWAATATLLFVLSSVVNVVPGPPASHAMASAPQAGIPRVGPWDPLVGSPTIHVPKFHVSTAHLAPAADPHYLSGTPVWLAYDPGDSSFWVATLPNIVSVLTANYSYTVTAQVAVGQQPFGVAADGAAHEVFVSNSGSNNVTVLSDISNSSVASIGVGAEPMGLAFDPTDNEIFVANQLSNNVTVISIPTLSVVASISVGEAPIGVAFDPATDQVFVANHNSYSVSIISAATNVVVANTTVGVGPYGLALDNATDSIFVTNEGSDNVSILNGSTGRVLSSVPVVVPYYLDLQGLVFDPNTNQVWIGGGYDYLVVLNASPLSAANVAYVYSTDPAGVAFDPANGTICLTNAGNSTFECLTPVTPAQNTRAVTFTETGLPAGTIWSVGVQGGAAASRNASSIVFYPCPANSCLFVSRYTFVIPPAGGYVPTASRVIVDISVTTNVAVSFSPGVLYPAYFNETGLGPSTGWSVQLNGTTLEILGASAKVLEPDGSYNYTTGLVPGYSPSLGAGTVRVHGSSSSVAIAFTPVQYLVIFYDTGLPVGTTWYVNITSGPPGFPLVQSGPVTGQAIPLDLPNGSYSYSSTTPDSNFIPTGAGAGGFNENGGTPSGVLLTFVAVNFTISFGESGLPSGTPWGISVNGTVRDSTSSVLNFSEVGGSYTFTVQPVSGFRAVPAAGTVVSGLHAPVGPTVHFVSTRMYAAYFDESGLPAGRGWSVAIGNQIQSSLTNVVTLFELNGTYGYVIQAVSGFTTTYSGTITIAGANVSTSVVFLPQEFPLIVVEVGLPNGTQWSVTVTNTSAGFNETQSTKGSAILIYLPNGTYDIQVTVPPGYTANLSSTTVTVAGSAAAGPSIQFEPKPAASPSPSGVVTMIPQYVWAIVAGLAIAVAALVAVIAWQRTRPPKSG